jgi:hypothetical protein
VRVEDYFRLQALLSKAVAMYRRQIEQGFESEPRGRCFCGTRAWTILAVPRQSRPRYENVVATHAPVTSLYVGQLAVSCSKELSGGR